MSNSSLSKMRKRIALMAALTVSLSMAPAVTPTGSGIFSPISASAATIPASSIKTSNIVLKSEDGSRTYSSGETIESNNGTVHHASFDVEVPESAKKGDKFVLYLATNNPQTDPVVRFHGLSGKLTIGDKNKEPIVEARLVGRTTDPGGIEFTLLKDMTSEIHSFTAPLHVIDSRHSDPKPRVGELGVFNDRDRTDVNSMSGVTFTRPGYEWGDTVDNFFGTSTDPNKGFNYSNVTLYGAKNPEPHSTYIELIPKNREIWRMYHEYSQDDQCIYGMSLYDREDTSEEPPKKIRSLTKDDVIIECTNDVARIYMDNIPANQALRAQFISIAPYTDEVLKYQYEVKWVDGPVGAGMEALKAKPFDGRPTPDGKGHKISHYVNSLLYPDTKPGNPDILDGPLSSSTYTAAYAKQTIKRGQTMKVPLQEQDDREFPEGYSVKPHKNVPEDWVKVNSETGEVTLEPEDSAKLGVNVMEFLLTHADGSTQVVPLTVTVEAEAETPPPAPDPHYTGETIVKQGQVGGVDKPKGTYPSGTAFSKTGDTPSWVTVKPDGSLTVEPGADVTPKTYKVPVKVTYPGDTEPTTIEASITVIARDKDNAVYSPKYTGSVTVSQDSTAEVSKPTGEVPQGTKYSKTDDTPNWVTVKSDGTLVVSPGTKVDVKSHKIPVKVTYPDKSTSTITATVKVTKAPDNISDPVVSPPVTVEVNPGVDEGGSIPGPGKKDNVKSYRPSGDHPDWVDVDPETGDITFNITCDTKPGTYEVPVEVVYSDDTTSIINRTIEVKEANTAACTEVSYPEGTSVKQGGEAKVDAPKGLPSDAKVEPADSDKLPKWVKINPDGSVDLTPGYDVDSGVHKIPVKVTYADGTSSVITLPVTVVAVPDSERYPDIPPLDPIHIRGGDSGTVPGPDSDKYPKGTKFILGNPDFSGWVTVDPDTGELLLRPDCDIKPGEYRIPVTMEYPDGTSQEFIRTVIVDNHNLAKCTNEVYLDIALNPGDRVEISPTPTTPDNTRFERDEKTPRWVLVDEDGRLTVVPPMTTKPGIYEVPIKLHFSDGTERVELFRVTLGDPPVNVGVDFGKLFSGNSETPSVNVDQSKRGVLAVTGTDVGVLPALAISLIVGGLAALTMRDRRRKN